MPAEDTSARGIITAYLAQYGLEALADWAWNYYIGADGGPGHTFEEVKLALTQQQAFKDRFPAYDDLAQRGIAISPDLYIDYERRVFGYLQQYGVPSGMYDTRESIAQLLRNDVSSEEVGQRLGLAAAAAFASPQEVRDALRDRYGVTSGDLVGFYLDPDKALPLIQQQFTAAQVAGAATQQGIDTTTEQAERLAAQGVTFDEARSGFGQVRALGDLEQQVMGDASVTREALVGAAFGDASASQAVDEALRGRRARYTGQQGGAAATGAGVSGLGTAAT